MALGCSFLGTFWSVLALLASEGNSDILVQQPRGPIYAQSGAVLTLECTVTGDFPEGFVKWFKGEGAGRKLIFSTYRPLPRITRKEEDSDTDFTIFLHNVAPEDAGMYYCVAQRRKVREEKEDLQSGPGTGVLVDRGPADGHKPGGMMSGDKDILVQQPRGPVYVQSGAVLTLECTVSSTFQAGPVKWFKGEGAGRELIFTNYYSLNRVTRKEEDSNTDFTIFLHNVVPADAGVYYCVKQKTILGGGEDLQSGRGTEVLVDKVDYRIPVAVATVCILLLLLISGAVYFCIKKRRGSSRSRHPSRPEFPLPENERTPRKDPKAKEIVYAEVELSKIPPTPKPRNLELRSEYATVRTAQNAAG